MRLKKSYLMTPGPTMIPPQVLSALSRPTIHHRTPQYSQLFEEVIEGLRYIFQTKGDILVFASSGTGAMQACVENLFSEKDHVVVINAGKFGERWTEICNVYKLRVNEIKLDYGEAVSPQQVEDILKSNKDIKGVFATLCETSTATSMPIKEIAKITNKYQACLIVDAISGLLTEPLYQDEDMIDVVVAGSQKTIMLPPGLAFISISQNNDKVKKMMKISTLPKYYFSFDSSYKALKEFQTPFTPAVNLIIALVEAVRLIKEEGIENIYKRHKRLAEATREAIGALKLQLLSKCPSNAVTAIVAPEGIKVKDIINELEEDFGIKVAEGQAELKDKIFRIAHMGYVNEFDIISTICGLEWTLYRLGYTQFTMGDGITAAARFLYKNL